MTAPLFAASILLGLLGTTELMLILAIVVLLFGVGKLPEVGRHLGAGIRNFKSEVGSDAPAATLTDDSRAAMPSPRDVTDQHRAG
jgi:sec-independent protein translocase protein TatA